MPNQLEVVNFLPTAISLGDVFINSGMFKDVKTQSEAVVKILAGSEVGLRPIESMNEVFIVNGKTSLTTKVICRLVGQSKKYRYHVDKIDNEECAITFFNIENGVISEAGKSAFTMKDAAKAGLANKDVWKNYPRNMLFARAFSNGQRWYAPDVYTGYSKEELDDIDANKIPEKTKLEFDENGQLSGGTENAGEVIDTVAEASKGKEGGSCSEVNDVL